MLWIDVVGRQCVAYPISRTIDLGHSKSTANCCALRHWQRLNHVCAQHLEIICLYTCLMLWALNLLSAGFNYVGLLATPSGIFCRMPSSGATLFSFKWACIQLQRVRLGFIHLMAATLSQFFLWWYHTECKHSIQLYCSCAPQTLVDRIWC